MPFIAIIKKNSPKIFSFFCAFSLLFFLSCNDKPSDLAINLLPDTVAIKTISSEDTILITGKTVYSPDLPIFNSGSIFIGKYQDIEAASLINFAYLPDTLSNLKVENIDSVQLNIFPERYAMGDTLGGTLSFDIYKVIRRWTPDATNYDSLFISPANYFANEKLTTWEGNIELKDSMDRISINLPSELIIDWLQAEMELDTETGNMVPKRIPNWGLAFVPNDNSSAVYRFSAAAPSQMLPSTIVVAYKNDGQDTTSYLNLVSGVDVAFLNMATPDTSDIVIQNGINYWTKIDFDLSLIPRLSGIHKAQFELTLDESRSRNANVPLDSVVEFAFYENDMQSIFFDYTGIREANSTKYIFPSITGIVQHSNKSSGKFSLVLQPYTLTNQSRELERLTFFGINDPDPEKRPVLKIIYSLNPSYLEPQK